MRLIKMLGLAMIAALASMAFIGASSASAEPTALCKEAEELVCPTGSQYPIGTVVLGQLSPQGLTGAGSTLLGPNLVLEVTCFESHSSGKTTTSLAKPFTGNLETLNFGHCFHKSSTPLLPVTCTVEIPKLGELLLLKTAPNLGTGSVHGVLAIVTCGTAFKCAYETAALPYHATGTETLVVEEEEITHNPKLRFNHAKLKVHTLVGEVSCPKEGFFDATYEITSPTPGYITL